MLGGMIAATDGVVNAQTDVSPGSLPPRRSRSPALDNWPGRSMPGLRCQVESGRSRGRARCRTRPVRTGPLPRHGSAHDPLALFRIDPDDENAVSTHATTPD